MANLSGGADDGHAAPLSVYKWESGQVQPRAAQLGRIAVVHYR